MCIVCGSGTGHLLRAIAGRHAPARPRGPGRLAAHAVAPAVVPPLDPRAPGDLAGPADVILRGGPILTMAEAAPAAEAIAVRAGRIQAVGDAATVLAHRGRLTRVIDLRGKALLPGFVNAHWHMPFTLLCDWVDATAARSGAAMLAALAAAVPAAAPGEWFVLGVRTDPPGTTPAPGESLDAAAPANPVLIADAEGNIVAGNSLAAAAARPLPGHVSGLLGRFAERLAVSPVPIRARLKLLLEQTAATGVTCLRVCGLGTLAGPDDLDLLREVTAPAPRLRLRGTLDAPLLAAWNELRLEPGFGDDMFRVDTVCAWAGDAAGDLAATLRRARGAGWQVTLHAAGDAQVQSALACLKSLRAAGAALDRRCGIECRDMPAPAQVARLRRLALSLGLAADGSGQPPSRGHRPPISLGMDAAAGPSPPLHMLAACRNLGLSPTEALAAVTIDAARRCGAGAILGSLERGKYADFAFLDRDPRALAPPDLAALRCRATWLNGQEVFRA